MMRMVLFFNGICVCKKVKTKNRTIIKSNAKRM